MIDAISAKRIGALHPKVRDEVFNLIEKADIALSGRASVRVVQGYRTFEEQSKLYAQGRTTPGKIVTNARAGASFHNYGLSIDFCLIIDGKEVSWDTKKDFDGDLIPDWMEVIKIFKDAGWSSGADWKTKDMPHLERTFGYTWQQLYKKYQNKEFEPTKYIKL